MLTLWHKDQYLIQEYNVATIVVVTRQIEDAKVNTLH